MKHAALLLACFCTPAFAASTVEIPCDKDASPIHELEVSEITADPAAHESELPPRVEMLRKETLDGRSPIAIEETDDPAEEVVIRDAVDRSLPLALPGDDTALYKRRMYRTDI